MDTYFYLKQQRPLCEIP